MSGVATGAAGMQAVVDFILELDKLKAVTRKTRPLGLSRYENSAEHSWQIAMLVLSLAPYAPPGIDMNRVVGMMLVHDIGEIDTGDTIVYAEDGAEARKQAEQAAVRRIFGLLPAAQAKPFMALWREFDDALTPEARFAHAADRAMPVLLNLANHGQSWRENGISHARVLGRIAAPIREGCPALWAHLAARLDEAQSQGWFGSVAPAAAAAAAVAEADEVTVVPIALAHVPGFHACLDAVAREKRYLAQFEAPPLARVETFVGEGIAADVAQFVALHQGKVVGWADVFPAWPAAQAHCGTLGMGLLPAWRGQGIGRRLLQACIDKAWRRGLARIDLEVRVDNGAAIRLYERLGFVPLATSPRALRVDGIDHDALLMVLLKDAPAEGLQPR